MKWNSCREKQKKGLFAVPLAHCVVPKFSEKRGRGARRVDLARRQCAVMVCHFRNGS